MPGAATPVGSTEEWNPKELVYRSVNGLKTKGRYNCQYEVVKHQTTSVPVYLLFDICYFRFIRLRRCIIKIDT